MIRAIEDGILARLRAAAPQLGYAFATLETYPEDWDAYLDERAGLVRTPAAWVTFGGWGAPDGAPMLPVVPVTLGLVVAASNQRSEQSARRGGAAGEIGAYQLLEDVATLLAGQDLGLPIAAITLGRARMVRPDPKRRDNWAMFALELFTSFAIEARDVGDNTPLPDFATFHANWDVPPHGGIGPALPDDARADAVDHVQMETAP